MASSIAEAAASGAMGLGFSTSGNIISGAFNYLYNKNLMRQQYNYNLDLWNKQNEYNSPTAQMQRLQEAGLNPNLVYGSGAAGASGNATSANGSSAPSTSGASFNPQLSALSEINQLRSALDVNESVANRNNAEASLANQRALTEPVNRQYIESQTKVANASLDEIAVRCALGKSNIELNKSKISLNSSQTGLNYQLTAESRQKVELYKKQGCYYVAQAHLADAQAKLANGQYDQLQYQRALLIAQAVAATNQGSYLKALETQTMLESEFQRIENQFQQGTYDWRRVNTNAQNRAASQQVELQLKAAAAHAGIDQSVAYQWADAAASLFGRVLGGVGSVYHYNQGNNVSSSFNVIKKSK